MDRLIRALRAQGQHCGVLELGGGVPTVALASLDTLQEQCLSTLAEGETGRQALIFM